MSTATATSLHLIPLSLLLTLLRPLALLIELASVPISPSFYPFPLATTLHAARIAHAYRGRIKALGFEGGMKARGRGVELAGYLVMCWGGSFITSLLTFSPPPQLLSPYPLTNYLSTYFLLTHPRLLPYHPSPSTLDTLLPIIDALTRSFPITGTVLACANHVNPAIRGSWMYQVVLGGLAASGGGIAATTLGVFNPEWKISTPPLLHGGWLGSLDFTAAAVASALFGFLINSNPAYLHLRRSISSFFDPTEIIVKRDGSVEPLMTTLGAKSVVVLFLSLVYATRAYVLHGSKVEKIRVKAAGSGAGKKAGGKEGEKVKVSLKEKKEL